MRKKGVILLTIVLCVVILLTGLFFLNPFHVDTGTYIAGDSPFILFDNGSGEPVVMLPPEGKGSMFSKWKTGDRILIIHNGTMMLSYPAQMNVYFCIRLKKGEASDVPEDVMKSLEEMGWLQGGTIGQD